MSHATPAECFARDYAASRALFLAACGDAGHAALSSERHPLPGPDGAPLFVDVARFGPPDAARVLFVLSGTHGVEGLCGSGVQTFLLRDGLAGRLPRDLALVLVHAVNPWGFAWLRRVNEDNVDLNRNFLDHAALHPENPDYDDLSHLLNPTQLDPADVAAALEALRKFQSERGMAAAYRALSGGQYRHPRGVQFGGRHAVWSNRMIRRVWAKHAASAELAVNLDLHSGLGPTGVGLLLQTAAAESPGARIGAALWPDVIRADPAQGSDSALGSGLMGPAFDKALPGVAGCGLVLEFGTRDMTEVILAVQAESWLHHHGDRSSDVGRSIVARMRDAFLLDDEEWKEKVCRRAQEVVDRALSGLSAGVPEATGPATDATPRVRQARPADLDALVRFGLAMAKETEDLALDPETLHAGAHALMADTDRGRTFVVESGGEVVAALMLTPEWSDWRNGFFWWIQNVYVRPEHRRRGHYRRLHDHVAALAARDPEVYGLRLYVEHENANAQATYEALGMRETDYRLFEQSTRPGRPAARST